MTTSYRMIIEVQEKETLLKFVRFFVVKSNLRKLFLCLLFISIICMLSQIHNNLNDNHEIHFDYFAKNLSVTKFVKAKLSILEHRK